MAGAMSVSLHGYVLDTEAERHRGVFGGSVWAVGMGGVDVLGPPSPAQGCAGLDASAPPPSPFPVGNVARRITRKIYPWRCIAMRGGEHLHILEGR